MDQSTLVAHVSDLAKWVAGHGCPRYTQFLDERAVFAATACLKAVAGVSFNVFAGHDGGERAVVGIFPDGYTVEFDEYPIVAVKFSYRKSDKLAHRDFLGVLMSLGIERDMVGDIIVGEGETVAFLHKNIADYCISQIDKIGSVGVKITVCDASSVKLKAEFAELTQTVASLRADNVVSAMCNVGRGEAVALIEDGNVIIDGIVCQKITRTVGAQSKISVKGYGKYMIVSADKQTRKGRTVLEFKKYI